MYKPILLLQLFVLFTVGSLALSTAHAASYAELTFANQAQEQRYTDLIAELRCLVCQNQSLSDSDADLAKDLRKEVYEMMQQGKDNAAITDFLVARYGDFVLYRPPVKSSTLLLWFLPIIFVLIALAVLFKTLIKPKSNTTTTLNTDEQAQLSALLNDAHKEKQKNGQHSELKDKQP